MPTRLVASAIYAVGVGGGSVREDADYWFLNVTEELGTERRGHNKAHNFAHLDRFVYFQKPN